MFSKRRNLIFGALLVILISGSMFTVSATTGQQKIFLESTRGGSSTDPVYDDIYMMNIDGTGLTRLTESYGYDGVPTMSPDGRYLAFESWRDGNPEIFIMRLDNLGFSINLSVNPAVDEAPSFSPDGSKIVFDSNRGGQFDIWVMNFDGFGVERLTYNGGNCEPSWSPDGTMIVYESNGEIYKMNADGTNQTPLTNSPARDGWPAWSPDGSKIAFVSLRDGNPEIYVMNADGSNQTNVSVSSANEWYPAWSLDGSKIIFQSSCVGNYELYEMNPDGSRQMRLTMNSAYDEAPVWGIQVIP